MLSQTMKPTHHSPPTEAENEKHKHNKQLDREVKDMVNAITDRITDLHKTGSSLHNEDDDDDDHGVRIITLAGTNSGATLRSELDDKDKLNLHHSQPDPLTTYVNSNFQAVNNSIMFSSTYNTNDPGVHLDITDVFEHHAPKPDKHSKKSKKKDKEVFKSDQHTEQSN